MSFKIVRNDITKIDADVIVNAANTGLKMGEGVCGSIFKVAGKYKLQAECDGIGGCSGGSAVITKGYDLLAKYIIHTVGLVWNEGQSGEIQALSNCYTNSLYIAN